MDKEYKLLVELLCIDIDGLGNGMAGESKFVKFFQSLKIEGNKWRMEHTLLAVKVYYYVAACKELIVI